MDEKPDQIIGQIEAQRDELGRNLNELETRVRRSTDWRTYYDRNPMMMLGAALGGGILLGSVVGSRGSSSSYSYKPGKKYWKKGSSKSSSTYPTSSGRTSSSTYTTPSSTYGTSSYPGSSEYAAPSYTPSRAADPSYASTSSGRGSVMSSVAGFATGLSSGGGSSSLLSSRFSETLDDVKHAMVAFGVAKAKEFLSQAIPGFDQHLGEAERHRTNLSSSDTGGVGSSGPTADAGSHGTSGSGATSGGSPKAASTPSGGGTGSYTPGGSTPTPSATAESGEDRKTSGLL